MRKFIIRSTRCAPEQKVELVFCTQAREIQLFSVCYSGVYWLNLHCRGFSLDIVYLRSDVVVVVSRNSKPYRILDRFLLPSSDLAACYQHEE